MSQKAAIREHLELHGSITPIEALNLYGCFRLGARILELREEGMHILTTTNDTGKQYAIYTLVRNEQLELAL